jgi:hypothetical protein
MRYAHSGENIVSTDNAAFGFEALRGSTNPAANTGQFNTAIGAQAMLSNTAGDHNVAVGSGSMRNNTGGYQNTSVGRNALYSNNGFCNTAIGSFALESNTAGVNNVAIGWYASGENTLGFSNTAIGSSALVNNLSGDYRTGLGYSANTAGISYNNNTGLGYNADCTASNQVRIGNSAITSIGGYTSWTNISDSRFKHMVAEDVVGLDFIRALRPVTYQMDLRAIDDWWAENYAVSDSSSGDPGVEKSKIRYSGFIAQEVEAAAKALGYSFSGVDGPKNEKDFYGLRYAEFTVPLVKAVQELAAENALLKIKMEVMLKEIEKLNSEISNLKQLDLRVEALDVLLNSQGN